MEAKTIVPMIQISSLAALLAVGTAAVFGGQKSGFDSRIAFIQPNATTPNGDVYTMNPDGSDVRQLTNLGADKWAFWENWSADGRQLVFSEYSQSGLGQLWLMNADGSQQHLLLSEADYAENAPSFSPDGALVVFTRCQKDPNGNGCAIFRIRTDGTGLTPLTDFQLEVGDWEPVYSPDGTTIAFDSFSRDGFIVRVWLMNADGSDIHPVTPPELLGANPHWSPDGEKIVFRSNCCGHPQNNDIWVINRDGSGLYRLTGNASGDQDIPVAYYNEAPSWAPQGRAVVFDQYDPKANISAIFVIGAGGGRMNQLMRFSLARPRMAQQAGTDGGQHKRRHQMPHEIEQNGAWPRWSPELP